MNKSLFKFVIISSLTVIIAPAASEANTKKDVEIFVHGQRHSSVSAYNTEKVRAKIREMLYLGEVDPEIALEERLNQITSDQYFNRFSPELVQRVVTEFLKENEEPSFIIQEETRDIELMENMLNVYKKKHADPEIMDMSIDPDKVKTIIISSDE